MMTEQSDYDKTKLETIQLESMPIHLVGLAVVEI
jgi:hypothetical protein